MFNSKSSEMFFKIRITVHNLLYIICLCVFHYYSHEEMGEEHVAFKMLQENGSRVSSGVCHLIIN